MPPADQSDSEESDEESPDEREYSVWSGEKPKEELEADWERLDSPA